MPDEPEQSPRKARYERGRRMFLASLILLTFGLVIPSLVVATWDTQDAVKKNDLYGVLALVGFLVGLCVLLYVDRRLRLRALRAIPADAGGFDTQMSRLVKELKRSSSAVDGIIADMNETAERRAHAIRELEGKIAVREHQHSELSAKLESLHTLTPQAVTQLESMLGREGQRSAVRDYVMMTIGLVGGAVIPVILKRLGMG